MGARDVVAITVTSAFLAASFAHALREFVIGLRSEAGPVAKGGLAAQGAEKERLDKKIYRLMVLHLGLNDFVLFILLAVMSGILCVCTKNRLNTVCFNVGALTSVLTGFLSIMICKRTAPKLVSLSRSGIGHVYKRGLANSAAVVVLCLGLNAASLFILSSVLAMRGGSGEAVATVNTLSLFAFGNLFVTLFSRLSGGLFTSSCNILLDSDLDQCYTNRTMFENMNNYLQNVYQLGLEVSAIVSTLACTYFFVMGRYTKDGEQLGASFGYLNFPVAVLSFTIFLTVACVLLLGWLMKLNTLRRVRASYLYTVGLSLLLAMALLPVFHALFLPGSLNEVKFNRYVAYGLVGLGLKSGLIIALSNYFFLSGSSAPGRSVALSVLSSLTGGLVNSLSYSKVLCFVPIACVCVNLFVCLTVCGFYGLMFVCIGYMCSIVPALMGSVFYSLLLTASSMAEYSSYGPDVTDVLSQLKGAWSSPNQMTRPFLATWTIMLGMVLLNHQSVVLELKTQSYMNPFTLTALLLGALFPVLESGIILRSSSRIANMRLRKSNYFYLVNSLYRKDEGEEPEPSPDPEEKDHGFKKRLLDFFRHSKKDENSPDGSPEGDSGNMGSDNQNAVKQNGADGPSGDAAEDVEVKVQEGPAENYRSFGRAFKNCLLREAGVNEELLINAPITCSSARSTQEEYLIPHLNDQAVCRVPPKEATPPEPTPEYSEEAEASEEFRHDSRDYRILKNADSHYKIFHPKYHRKHFNLKKKSAVASGSFEELQHLLPLAKNECTENDLSAAESDSTAEETPVAQDDGPGDSLDRVYRRSENVEKEVLRTLNLPSGNQSSCGSSCYEREAPSLLKVLNNNEVHSKDPESDSEGEERADSADSSDYQAEERGADAGQGLGPAQQSRAKLSLKELKRRTGRKPKNRRNRRQNSSDGEEGREAGEEASASSEGERAAVNPFDSESSASESEETLGAPNAQASLDEGEPEALTESQLEEKFRESMGRTPRKSTGSSPRSLYPASSREQPTESARGGCQRESTLEINVEQSLLPPDVRISDRPRRPTPKSIELPVFRDLEAAAEAETPRSDNTLGPAKKSPLQNTYHSMVLSLVPLVFALGAPFFVGICLGKNGLHVFLLFSIISSSLLAQVLSHCSMSWESAVQFLRAHSGPVENGRAALEEAEIENARTCRKVGRIVGQSVAPVLNTLIVLLPLISLFRTDFFNNFSNSHGFPSWTSFGS